MPLDLLRSPIFDTVLPMKFLDLTLDTPAENLALDEALLNAVDSNAFPDDVFRLWEPAKSFVVIGRASKFNDEVDFELCLKREIPVLRRCSGGASIVAGPGCLMYGVILSLTRFPELRQIEKAHDYVLTRIRAGVRNAGIDAAIKGTSDLVVGDRKFSGNSLRCKRNSVLYHGTLLYDFPLELIGQCLKTPPRQPDYRLKREHDDFVGNLNVDVKLLRSSIASEWPSSGDVVDWPQAETTRLAIETYSDDKWNQRH